MGLKKTHRHSHDSKKNRLSFDSTNDCDKNCFHPIKNGKKTCEK